MCWNLLNWTAAVLLFYIYGRTALILLNKGKGKTCDCVAAGAVIATAAAECRSLAGAVDFRFFLVFAALGALLGLMLVLRRGFRRAASAPSLTEIVPAGVLSAYFLAISSLWPSSYDDYLYHAQALRWTEEYGVVPGLGNLHCRLAYNSAFLSLQALFSWHDAAFPGKPAGMSLHAMNGLLAALLGVYCIVPLLREVRLRLKGEKTALSAAGVNTRIAALVYLFGNTQAFTGLDTDPMALIGILFLFIRLSDAVSGNEPFTEALAFSSVFAAFLCTVKLSAGALVFLAVWPLIHYIREKKLRSVLFFVVLSAAVTLPFFARGVLLSGYLVYPYTGIDLFDTDWKIPYGTALLDREGIILWGRGLYGEIAGGRMTWPEAVSLPFAGWFPCWYRGISTTAKALFVLCGITAAGTAVTLWAGRNDGRKDRRRTYLFAAAFLCLVFWVASAPLERYGSVFMLIVLSQARCFSGKAERAAYALTTLVLVGLLLLRIVSPVNYHGIAVNLPRCVVTPMDYAETEMRQATVRPSSGGDGLTVFVPESGDRGDYVHFPAAKSMEDLSRAELRGEGFEDGFRAVPAP